MHISQQELKLNRILQSVKRETMADGLNLVQTKLLSIKDDGVGL